MPDRSCASISIRQRARVLDTASGRDWLGWLHSFHESLTLREWKGREIVGVIGIAMLISALSGIYLWWPAGRIRVRAAGFRRGFALHRNLHYTFGIWGALVLATLSFTGLFLAYQDAGRAVVANFGSVSPSPRGLQSTSSGGDVIALDEAVAIAQQRVGNAAVIGLGLPAGPRGVYRVNLREAGDTSARSTTVVFIDPRSRSILQAVDRTTRGGGDTFLSWQRMLHEGSAFGIVWRFLVFLGGMLPALMMVTGLMMWLRRHRRPSRATSACGRNVRRLAGQLEADVRHQSLAGALDQIEHPFEAFRPAVIGIGYFAHAKFRHDIEKQRELATMIARPQCLQLAQIQPVHRIDAVEALRNPRLPPAAPATVPDRNRVFGPPAWRASRADHRRR